MLLNIRNFIRPDQNDPDEIRRRGLINILSVGMLACSGLGLAAVIIFLIINPEKWQILDNQLLVFIAIISVIGSLSIYYINKYLKISISGETIPFKFY